MRMKNAPLSSASILTAISSPIPLQVPLPHACSSKSWHLTTHMMSIHSTCDGEDEYVFGARILSLKLPVKLLSQLVPVVELLPATQCSPDQMPLQSSTRRSHPVFTALIASFKQSEPVHGPCNWLLLTSNSQAVCRSSGTVGSFLASGSPQSNAHSPRRFNHPSWKQWASLRQTDLFLKHFVPKNKRQITQMRAENWKLWL